MLSADLSNIKRPGSIVSLVISLGLVPTFAFWVGRQEKMGKPALIPNSLWKKLPFTAISVMVLLSYGVCNGIELYSSLLYVLRYDYGE